MKASAASYIGCLTKSLKKTLNNLTVQQFSVIKCNNAFYLCVGYCWTEESCNEIVMHPEKLRMPALKSLEGFLMYTKGCKDGSDKRQYTPCSQVCHLPGIIFCSQADTLAKIQNKNLYKH